jgi:hypothetical protein
MTYVSDSSSSDAAAVGSDRTAGVALSGDGPTFRTAGEYPRLAPVKRAP